MTVTADGFIVALIGGNPAPVPGTAFPDGFVVAVNKVATRLLFDALYKLAHA